MGSWTRLGGSLNLGNGNGNGNGSGNGSGNGVGAFVGCLEQALGDDRYSRSTNEIVGGAP